MSEFKTNNRDSDEFYDRRSKNFDEKFCDSCGSIIKKEAEICVKCGVRQNKLQQSSTKKPIKSKTTAGILAMLLGYIGIHKFYMGNTASGVLYIIFSWTLIPGIIAFIEGIIYLTCESDEAFTEKYT